MSSPFIVGEREGEDKDLATICSNGIKMVRMNKPIMRIKIS